MMNTELITQDETELARHHIDGGEWWQDENKFKLLQRVAKMFSMSALVPDIYKGDRNIGNCVIAFNMAHRLKADPLMVMQNLYIVHGRPSWSAQFMIACFNQTGRFDPIRYEFVGTEGTDTWGCFAYTTDRESGEYIKGTTITIKMAKDEKWYDKSGSKWKTMPEQMLRYRSAAFLVRTVAPELTMGLHTEDESHDAFSATSGRQRQIVESVLDSLDDELPSDDQVEEITSDA